MLTMSVNFTPESQMSSCDEPRWVCTECLMESTTGETLETGLALGETTVLTDSDGTLWVYCVKCHKQFHVKCIRADSVNPSENFICATCVQ